MFGIILYVCTVVLSEDDNLQALSLLWTMSVAYSSLVWHVPVSLCPEAEGSGGQRRISHELIVHHLPGNTGRS